MNENALTDTLEVTDFDAEVTKYDEDRPTMVKVEHVSMVFNIANQKLNNLKEYAIALARRELMFKEFRALNDISIDVKKGDVFGILGTNGSGKSTLLKIIAGVLEPTEGTVEIKGNIAPLIELGAGFDYELTARENIYLNGALLGYPKQFINQHFDEIVEFAEVEEFLDMPLKNYSSGMVARIAFAIATVIVPEILIVDEVLSVGDYMFQQKCERRIQTLINDYNTTVLIVSHNNDQIERLCNKAIWIEKSRARIMGDAKTVCDTYRALGGHAGSSESEKYIFDILRENRRLAEGYYETIGGDNAYSTVMKVYNRTQFETPPQTVFLSHFANIPGQALMPWMMGATDGFGLITSGDELPDAMLSTIRGSGARRVVILDQDNEIGTGVQEALELYCPDVEEVITLDAPDIYELCFQALDWVRGEGLCAGKRVADTVCLVLGPRDDATMVISPLMYSEIVPLIYCEETPEALRRTLRRLTDLGFKRVVVHGGAFPRDPALVAVLADANDANEHDEAAGQATSADAPASRPCVYDCTEYWGHHLDYFTRNLLANDGAEKDGDDGSAETRKVLIIGSPTDLASVYAAAPLAAREHATILLADKNNMDSLAGALRRIQARYLKLGPFDHLIFLGGNTCFDEVSKQIIAKVADAEREHRRTATGDAHTDEYVAVSETAEHHAPEDAERISRATSETKA